MPPGSIVIAFKNAMKNMWKRYKEGDLITKPHPGNKAKKEVPELDLVIADMDASGAKKSLRQKANETGAAKTTVRRRLMDKEVGFYLCRRVERFEERHRVERLEIGILHHSMIIYQAPKVDKITDPAHPARDRSPAQPHGRTVLQATHSSNQGLSQSSHAQRQKRSENAKKSIDERKRVNASPHLERRQQASKGVSAV